MATPPRAQIARDATRAAHAAVIGNEALKGKLLGSGPILKTIDQLAAEVCWYVARKTVVTVAFDTFSLLHPVFHGDFVRFEGRALSVSNSSIVCQISVYRQDFASGAFQLTHNVVATFVAINSDGRPSGGLPVLYDPLCPEECDNLRKLAEQRRDLSTRWRKSQDEVSTIGRITHDMMPQWALSQDARAVNIKDTVIETRHPFLLKHANLQRNVFGGVLLDWMDRAALYCARSFTKNECMVTVGMNRVHFKLPIHLSDIISIRARVCRVKKYSLEIEIAVYRLQNMKELISHTGYYKVLNLESLEAPMRRKEIDLKVTADESDQDGMQALLRAYRRQLFEKDDVELLNMPPIPLSISKSFTNPPAKL
ncbi:hypothetical protein Poli38472_012511 [Pythium oligandrum]|uniref:HotDog ACOT-type domain-containing protein n=1 Tax=Pythium oligandrum TaxID=41045 RepID=A0A8K1FF69_PYTOL|nr:hypothetical protein Poli38472_012511 [Pythium oligandrum]|eukprot:TMW61320.1 hypothetical protein Poli38472_012511 [Pythium oligandrum]